MMMHKLLLVSALLALVQGDFIFCLNLVILPKYRKRTGQDVSLSLMGVPLRYNFGDDSSGVTAGFCSNLARLHSTETTPSTEQVMSRIKLYFWPNYDSPLSQIL